MKKFTLRNLILMSIMFLTFGIYARSIDSGNKDVNEVALKPLYEIFTSSTCYPCAYANPIFDVVVNANPTSEYSLIKYQMNAPGQGDPYYTEECGARGAYYGGVGIPDLYMNSDQLHPVYFTQEIYDSYQGLTTAMEINVVSADIDLDNMISVEVELSALDDYDAGLTAYIVVVEKLTMGNVGDNGEFEFHNVMMKMLPDASGTTLSAFSSGTTETLSFSYDMSNTNMEEANDLSVAIIVQDDSNKSVIQSEQVDVISALDDFTLNINITDENDAPVNGAIMVLSTKGTKVSNEAGQIIYDAVLPGTYNYTLHANGILASEGEIEVTDQDISIDINITLQAIYYEEEFANGLPSDWIVHIENENDALYNYDGLMVFARYSFQLDTLMLVSPAIDITPGEKIFFDIGDHGNMPMEMSFGYIIDPQDPTTFVPVDTIVPTYEYQTYEYVLEGFAGDLTEIHFAWSHITDVSSFCAMEKVIINYNSSTTDTYSGVFNVVDNNSNPIENAELVLENNGTTYSDVDGMITYGELYPGTYDYSVNKDGYETASGSITILDEEIFELVVMTEVISTYEIQFTIMDSQSPLSGAEITIDGNTEVSDANGEAVFTNLENGTYDYSISLNGFEVYDDQVVVNGENEEVEVNLVIDGIENMNNQNLEIFPNPSSDFFIIKHEEKIQSIDIYDMTGDLLRSLPIDAKEFKLDVSEYKKGIYLLMINTKEIIITKKVIIE